MRVALEIDAVGWAFSGEMFPVGGELARILRGVANQVHGADADFLVGIEQPLRDFDGNGVGVLTIDQ